MFHGIRKNTLKVKDIKLAKSFRLTDINHIGNKLEIISDNCESFMHTHLEELINLWENKVIGLTGIIETYFNDSGQETYPNTPEFKIKFTSNKIEIVRIKK